MLKIIVNNMASGAVDKIDSIYDVSALTAQQKQVEDLVKKTVAQIKAARKESIEFNVGTKSFDDYNKKIKELEKNLAGMQKSSDAATKSSILLAKQKEAEARASQQLAKQQQEEIRLRTLNEKATEKESAATQKASTSKGSLKDRPIESIPFEIKTGSDTDPNASGERVTQLEKEQAALDSAAAAESDYTKTKQQSASASTASAKAISEGLSPLQQSIILRNDLKNKITDLNKKQKEDNGLFKSGAITKQEYNKRLLETQTRVSTYKTKVQELDRVIKEDIVLEGKAGDAYKHLSAEYNKAALAAKNYQLTLGASNPITIQATAKAKALSDQLKVVDNSVGQNTRNVGNYANGIANAFGKTFSFLRTAANLIPGLGLGGLIGGLAIGIFEVGKAIFTANKAFDEGKEFAKAYKDALREVNEEAIKGSTEDVTKLQFYLSVLNDTTQSQHNRTQALKAYNAIADDANKIDENQINNLDLINQKINAQIILIEKRALTRAAESILADKAEVLLLAKEKARLNEEEKLRLDIEAGRSIVTEAVDIRTGKAIKSSQEFLNIEKKRAIEGRINADINVRNAQVEFDGTRKALYDLLKTEGFAADEGTKIKEKKEKKGRDIAEANRKAEFEILKAQIELDKEFDLRRANDEKRSYEERLGNLITYGADSQRLINAQAEFDLGAAKLTSDEKLKIENDKNNALIRLSQELADKLANITAKQFKVDTSVLSEQVKGLPVEIQKALDNYKKFQDKAIKDHKDALKELAKDTKAAVINLASELEGLFFDIFVNQIEREKNAIQDEIDLLEAKKQKDIEVANQSITNATERADAIAVIEARAAAKRQQLELKQRQLDQQKARFEKARTIAEIIQSTSLAVVNALTQVKTLGPGAIALAAIIGTIGAIQIARALAQPIPKYKDGTKNHPGGLGVVGDGGKSEGIELPDGTVYKTPATATIVDMPKGSKVYKDYSNMKVAASGELQVFDTRAELRQGFNQVVKAVKNIPQPVIQAERAWTRAHKVGSSFRNYLNQKL